MSGMGTQVNLNDPNITAAFHGSLLHQLLLLVLVTLGLFVLVIGFSLIRPGEGASTASPLSLGSSEPKARRILRYGFGLLWIFDGVLQLQPAMPLGIPTQVMAPTLSGQPAWVRDIITFGIVLWEKHPIQAADSLVWIQIGLGIWVLASKGSGRLSRLAGAASVAWALGVWVFGEGFGGIFAQGASWYFGSPGAVLFYGVGGLLLAAPPTWFASERVGRTVLRGIGVVMVLFGLLQLLPGGGQVHSLYSMTSQMAKVSQPAPLAAVVGGFSRLVKTDGSLISPLLALLLLGTGAALIWQKNLRLAFVLAAVLATVTWALVEDFGIFGGEGTDPNSAIPVMLLVWVSYVWISGLRLPGTSMHSESAPAVATRRSVFAEVLPVPTGYLSAIPIAVAISATLVGGAPLAYASITGHATTVAAEAIDGLPSPVSYTAPNFTLTDQNGKQISLVGERGKVVFLTFLDPVCTTDCPIIAQEIRQADIALGSNASKAEFVAVAANEQYYSRTAVQLFTQREGLGSLPNWHFVTGSLPQLKAVWKMYGEEVAIVPAGQMALHSDIAEIIDSAGTVRWVEFTDPGPSTSATQASFSQVFLQYINQTIHT